MFVWAPCASGEKGLGDGPMAEEYSREWVAETLRKLGYFEEADEALRLLPEKLTLEQMVEFSNQHGVSRGELVDRMGGSP